MTKNQAQTENPNASSELNRTQNPEQLPLDYVWEQHIFRRVGYWGLDMTEGLSGLDLARQESFKEAALAFSIKGDYSISGMNSLCRAINSSLNSLPEFPLNGKWAAQALELKSVSCSIGLFRNFLVFWNSRDLTVITNDALHILAKTKTNWPKSRNVLSDDPEKSWLTDEEYEALLATVWRSYENGRFTSGRTLMILLSMQYGRRPVQLAQLKIKDFRIAAPDDSSGLSGLVVDFPGAKDSNAETGFRDSKFEHHPLPEHLWNLFEIQRNEIRTFFESKLGTRLTDSILEELPVFTSKNRINKAISRLNDHYKINWRTNLDHQLFHSLPIRISANLAWKFNQNPRVEKPLSHRTGQPIVISATRMRHTRARQLARKGVRMHVLSHWLGHTNENSVKSYYNDPAEDARKLDEAMAPSLMPLAMAFAGKLIDSEDEATRRNGRTERLEFAKEGALKNVGNCGKQSFCATTSVPIPCYRCRHFEPLVSAPHQEVLDALEVRQKEENSALRIGGARDLLLPIDLSADILAVKNCINRCAARMKELGIA